LTGDSQLGDLRRSKRTMPKLVRVDAGDRDVLLMSLTGLVSQNNQEDVVVQGSGLSRGDKRRNAKLARLRELVPVDNAILGIDLADEKQAIVLIDHDSQVLARTRGRPRRGGWGRCCSGVASRPASTGSPM
jgi:transposase